MEYHGHPDFGFNQENIQFFLEKITHGNEWPWTIEEASKRALYRTLW
jgi:hypothetical protein